MSAFAFKPAAQFTERAGLFVGLTGSTCSGKTFSSLRLARGIAGPEGKIAVLDTEGGRTLHLKREFDFDANVMDPPFQPERFAEAALAAEEAKYDALLIDSFSMEWVGLGGVLDWQAQELQRMAGDDARKQKSMKMASWIRPKMAHKAMVYSFLQRRIPIIFSIRGEETIKPGEAGEKPTKLFKSVCNKAFPFEVTVSFRLDQGRKGYIDLSDPTTYKMEGAHQAIFRDGERIGEDHGRALAEWARGVKVQPPAEIDPYPLALEAAEQGVMAFREHWNRLGPATRDRLRPRMDELRDVAQTADAAEDPFANPAEETPPAAQSTEASA
jgi:hypothetical protein